MNKYIARNRILLLLLILLSAVYGGLTAVVPIAAGSIIDFDATSGQTLLFSGSVKDLCIASASILACIVVFGILKVLVRTTYIYRVRKQIENDVFYAAIRSKVSSSSLINMFCLEIDKIIDGYFTNHGEVVGTIVPFLIALGYSLSVSWLTIVIIAACFIVLLLLNQLLLMPMSKFMKALSERNESVNKMLLGFFAAITSLKIFGGVDYAFRRIQTALIARNKEEKNKLNYEIFVEGVNCLFSTLLQIVPLAIIAIMVVNGELTIGSALSIMLLFEKIVSPIDKISSIVEEYAESKAFRCRIKEFVSEHSEPKLETDSQCTAETSDLLNINDLSVTLNDRPIINSFSTVFEDKKKYLVIGRNGCGKSTLLKILTKQIDDYRGTINVFGKDLRDIPSHELFKSIGIIPQTPDIFEDTLLNNITLGKSADHSRLQAALKLAGLSENRLEEKVTEGWRNFSGGELQRIILARMFYNPKRVYCLDEVVSGLQYDLANNIENIIIEHLDSTVINVSHRTDAATVKKYDGIINMNLKNGVFK